MLNYSDHWMLRAADNALMALVADGDREAFALLYERHRAAATSLAMRMCARHALAEEIVQEAFLSCWRGRGLFDRTRGSVRAWVLGIVRNRAIDALRQGTVLQLADWSRVEPSVPSRTDALYAGSAGRASELLDALGELPLEQGAAIALAYYGGYTHSEIATMLDTPLGTVKARVRRGLRTMAEELTPA
jgi:RNA polymerase sigma-70 factor (ECF subfamily)